MKSIAAATIAPRFCMRRLGAAEAGVNVWTTNGPEDGSIRALAVDPLTRTILYAGTGAGVLALQHAAGP